MYDKKGRIVSPYDWDTYFKERGKHSGALIKNGIERGTLQYETEMQQWELQNTVEVEVDPVNHRFERMPIFMLPYNFQAGWSAA